MGNNSNIKYSSGQSFNVVALLTIQFQKDESSKYINALHKQMASHNCKMIVFSSVTDLYVRDKNDHGEEMVYSLFHPECFDYVIVLADTFFNRSDLLHKLVKRTQLVETPIIVINSIIEKCHNIVNDVQNDFGNMIQHVIHTHNKRRLNMIGGIKDNSYSEERITSYRNTLIANNIPVEEERIGYGNFYKEPALKVLHSFIESELPFPEAIICANDAMAIAVAEELIDLGYRIPEDVIVTGYDGITMTQYSTPTISTTFVDCELITDKIFEIMEVLKANPQYAPCNHTISGCFLPRESCGCSVPNGEHHRKHIMSLVNTIDSMDTNFQLMSQMISLCNNYTNIKDIFSVVNNLWCKTNYSEMWFCTNINFLNPYMNYSYFLQLNHKKTHIDSFTSQIYVAMHSKGKDWTYGKYTTTTGLLPNLEEVFQRQDSILIVPIHLQGELIGYLPVCGAYSHIELTYFHMFILNFKHILANYKNHHDREDFLSRDYLTTMLNRSGFYKNMSYIIESCRSSRSRLTIIIADVNGLKAINDTYGHSEGDFTIFKIGECITKATPANALCARFGGDEFIIAFSTLDESLPNKIVNSIKKQLAQFNKKLQKPYSISASYGICTDYPTTSEQSYDYFIKKADHNMYVNKREEARLATQLSKIKKE